MHKSLHSACLSMLVAAGVLILPALDRSVVLGAPVSRTADDGAALLAAKRYSEAEAAFRKALEQNPDDIKALDGLAQALESQSKFTEAAKVYEQLGELLTKAAGRPAQPPAQPAATPPDKVTPPPATPVAPLPAIPAAAPAALGAPKLGEAVEVRSEGGNWYRGTVIEVKGNDRIVRYAAGGDASTELVTPDRIRPAAAENIVAKVGTPAVGEVLDVRDGTGVWYKSVVLKVDGDKRFIHYAGWSEHWNEWVTPERVRPYSVAAQPPSAAEIPKTLTFPAALGKPAAGEVLQALDKNGKWYIATVYKVDGDKRYVHYRNWDDGANEWLTADRVKPLTGAQIAGQSKARTLDGWYVKTEITAYGGSRLKCTYFWFRPDGTVHFGPPFVGGPAEVAAMQKADPAGWGAYRITGDDVTFVHGNGEVERHTYTPSAGGMMDSSPLQPVVRFKDDTKLEGTWGIDYSGTFGGVHSISSHTWVFRKDGAFEHTRVGGVETVAHTTGTGSAPGNAVGADAPIEKGTYTFSGGNLVVKSADGRTQTLPAWGVGSETDPSPLGIDGLELNRVK